MASRQYEGTSWKQADAFLRGSYGGKGADNLTIGNNTTMRRFGDDIAIRHWGTDIITYHPNGSTTLKIWDSVSTKARYSRWEVVYNAALNADHEIDSDSDSSVWAKTQSDASCSYEIGNPGFREGDLVELTLTKAGRISGVKRAINI